MRDRQEHKVETTLQFDQPVAMAAVQPKDSAPPRTGHDQGRATADARYWMQILSNYRTPSRMRSIVELVITAVPLVALWTAAWFAFSLGHAWASLLIAI
ncbi:MAG: fatty acid desaturase, partial [Bradyrhizobium sp.]|nr:fatty acid desaturase [Bradyrhizobium sp.]